MILTLTPNPTIDHVVLVRRFEWDAAVRAERLIVTPSGKGVDASLAIRELGGDTLVLGLKAGLMGRLHAGLLDEWGVRHDLVQAEGETRTAVVLVDMAEGRQSTISASTLVATDAHLARLTESLDRHARDAWGLICAGSLPPGLPASSYAPLLSRARHRGLFTLLDSSGQALQRGVSGLPHVLKVNCRELGALDARMARVDGRSSGELDALAGALRPQLGKWASDALVVTLGQCGALAVTVEGIYRVEPPRVPVSNTAGAGDALSGGLMLGLSQGGSWADALSLGTAAAASVVMNEGTGVCRREEALSLRPRVSVRRMDGSQGVTRS